MLFNSSEFLFAFLPVTLAGFYLFGSVSRTSAIRWLILASLLFYAWWRPLNVLIIAPSILVNFAVARVLLRLNADGERAGVCRAVLLLGIAFNIAFLGYFKYTNFVSETINDVFGANLVMRQIILPLGISFITFQKIAFLIDVQAGRVKSFSLQDYCIFVLFFPQLIAGPIVHYREMMPQFHVAPCRFDIKNLAVGLTLLSFGLFKKVVFADNVGLLVTPIYDHAAAAGGTSLAQAWIAALGFTLQIYFDFSGYTDMALGLARFFAIRLPQNFNSPLRATNIIDFWLRWHMTLTRFLTSYIFNPLALWLTRRRLAKGKSGFGAASLSGFITLLMFPTILTMLISGLWHGAGYGFIVWGLLHGCYLTINHGWRALAARVWTDRKRYDAVMTPVGGILTFLAVTLAMVFFRSPTVTTSLDVLRGAFGLNGIALPAGLLEHLGPLARMLDRIGVVATTSWSVQDLARALLWVSLLLFVALACPNTLEILARYEPALGVRDAPHKGWIWERLRWEASLPWALAMAAVTGIAVGSMGGPSEFLYWQF